MWKHKSTGENQLGDYDYYVYDDPRLHKHIILRGAFKNYLADWILSVKGGGVPPPTFR